MRESSSWADPYPSAAVTTALLIGLLLSPSSAGLANDAEPGPKHGAASPESNAVSGARVGGGSTLGEGDPPDCDNDGISDADEIAQGAPDCNGNGVPDACDTAPRFEVHTQWTVRPFAGARVLDVDLDGDGARDLLQWEFDDYYARLFHWENFNNAEALLGPRMILRGSEVGSPVVGDIDGDGDEDMLVVTRLLRWYENTNGNGSFGAPHFIEWIYPEQAYLADVDGDGDNDVVSNHSIGGGDRITVWVENRDGAGSFEGPHQTISATHGLKLLVADVDGDDDVDVVAYGPGSGNGLAWFENLDGAGHFGSARPIAGSIPVFNSTVRAADLDGDDDLDLFEIGGATSVEIQWWENLDGLGNFASPRLVDSIPGNSPRDVVATDVDGDGDLDLFTGYRPQPSWYENSDGAGEFVAGESVTGADALFCSDLDTADLDGDGREEILEGCFLGWRRYVVVSDDCDGNKILDACEIDSGAAGDCSGDGVLDRCEPDCDADGVPDPCESDCDGTGVADVCEFDCAFPPCDFDGDGCLDATDLSPTDPTVCGDSDRDHCDDCASGSYAPADDGPDFDSDGICDAGDCMAADPSAWLSPGPTRWLHDDFRWFPPDEPGADGAVLYDFLRSTSVAEFDGTATCVVTGRVETNAWSGGDPPVDGLFAYLPRATNACPAPGSLGEGSNGEPRIGPACP